MSKPNLKVVAKDIEVEEYKEYSFCSHGNCVDHEPDWKIKNEKLIQKRRILKKSIMKRCCGMRMWYHQRLITFVCNKCGATKEKNDHWYVVCKC